MPKPVGYLLRSVQNHMPAKARTGLYAGKTINTVNRVSREYEVRSRKLRKPHVIKRRLFSQALGEKVQLRLTTTALRAIDKAGGLDRYLLRTPDSLLHSDVGSDLKFRIGLITRHKLHQQQQQQLARQQQLRLGASGGGKPAPATALPGPAGSSISLLPRAAAAALAQHQQQQQQRHFFFVAAL